MLSDLVEVVAAKTGYDVEEIEPDFELEADLGIDTVKQAEILSALTDRYGVENDDSFRLADYPTLTALAGYLMGRVGGAGSAYLPGTGGAAPARDHAPAPVRDEDPAPTAVPLAPRERGPNGADRSLQELIEVVAEKTGYDVEEIEPDFELEADLGIDTVKQAEIISTLTDRYGIDNDDSFRLADYPTLAALAGYLAEARRGGAQGAGDGAGGVPEEDTDEGLMEVDDELVRTESGPPVSPDAPTPRHPPARSHAPASDGPGPSYEAVMADLEAVVAEKTGYDIEDLEPDFELEADLGIDTVKQAEILSALTERFDLPNDENFRPADHPTLGALARYLHAARSAAGDATTPPAPPRKRAALSELPFVAEEFDLSVGMSTEERVRANHIPLPPSFRLRLPTLQALPPAVPARIEGQRILVLGDTDVARAIRRELAANGAVEDGPYDAVLDAADDVMVSFRRAKALDSDRPAHWITITRMGGLGASASHDRPIARAYTDGARAGFTKSIGREWVQTTALVLDVDPEQSAGAVAARAIGELGIALSNDRSRAVEVVVDPSGDRHAVRLATVALPEPGALVDRPVVLLTGGGRGITARIALELARSGAGAIALVGRSEVSDRPLDEAAAKQQIRAQLQLSGDRVTPARVEAALSKLRRSEEVRRNLEALRELGLNVRYFQIDLADPDQAASVVDAVVEEFGQLDIVIHGAGTEESRQLKDKDETGFHRVFDGKAAGGLALIERLPPETRLVCMGSVAGRFGNPGQVDYAAANDALARICHSRPNSLQIDWTAWDDVGMAVRGGMRALLADRGVDLLPADAGAALLVSFLAAKTDGEVVVAGRLGDFEPTEQPHPFLDRIEAGDGVARGVREMSRSSDPWVLDHAIDGVPVLPGVIGLECMAAVAAELAPDLAYHGARNVRFLAPVKLHRDAPTTLVVEARLVGEGEVAAVLTSERRLATGRTQRTDHYEATLRFAVEGTAGDDLAGLPSVFLPDEVVQQDQIYRRFFHGPIFQVLQVIFGVSADGLVGEAHCDPSPLSSGPLITAPLVLEAAFQAAGLHRMMIEHTIGLPHEVSEVRLYRVPDPDAPLSITAGREGDRYHVDVDGVDGPVLRLRGFAMIGLGPVPPGDRFEEPDGGRPVCFGPGIVDKIVAGTTIAEASAGDNEAAWLAPDEIAELRARGTARRVADRIAGRIAAKRALSDLTGADPLAIRIWTAASGEPIARVPGHPGVRVSISHREGHAVAVAVSSGRIGVDLEQVCARPDSFGRTWFSDDERRLLGDPERQTVGWAVKEAVLKWLGTGLRASPHDVRIVEIGEGTARVALAGDSAALHTRLGGAPLRIRWATSGSDEVIVTVRSAA